MIKEPVKRQRKRMTKTITNGAANDIIEHVLAKKHNLIAHKVI